MVKTKRKKIIRRKIIKKVAKKPAADEAPKAGDEKEKRLLLKRRQRPGIVPGKRRDNYGNCQNYRKTVDEAVEEGLKKLGLSRAEAVIRVIEQPSSGLFGLFNKKDAVVEVGAAGSETEDVTETAGAADGEEETVSAAEEPGKTSWAAIRKKFLRRRRKNAAVRKPVFRGRAGRSR